MSNETNRPFTAHLPPIYRDSPFPPFLSFCWCFVVLFSIEKKKNINTQVHVQTGYPQPISARAMSMPESQLALVRPVRTLWEALGCWCPTRTSSSWPSQTQTTITRVCFLAAGVGKGMGEAGKLIVCVGGPRVILKMK